MTIRFNSLFCIIFCLFFYSCSIEKRLYNDGLHLDWLTRNSKPIEKKETSKNLILENVVAAHSTSRDTVIGLTIFNNNSSLNIDTIPLFICSTLGQNYDSKLFSNSQTKNFEKLNSVNQTTKQNIFKKETTQTIVKEANPIWVLLFFLALLIILGLGIWAFVTYPLISSICLGAFVLVLLVYGRLQERRWKK
jgi:hypothetical protein